MTEYGFAEAPFSINACFMTPQGTTPQITMRGETFNALLKQFEQAEESLLKKGWTPATRGYRGNGQGKDVPNSPPTLADGTPDPAWCPIHNCAMKRREKDGQVWYSHKVGDSWCKGQANGNGK